MKTKGILVGGDPEFFIKKVNGIGQSPCVGILPGNKDFPYKLKCGGAIQEDNVAAEINIKPAKTAKQFVKNINDVITEVSSLLDKKGYLPSILPYSFFTLPELSSPQAQEFGCSPDFNAYTKQINELNMSLDSQLRYAGGHIHLSFNGAGGEDLRKTILAMDVTLGLPSLLLDNNPARRQVYGKAGSHRPTEYGGVEYRTLSNFWLLSDELKEWVFNNTVYAINNREELAILAEKIKMNNIIDNGDSVSATKLIKRYNIPVPLSMKF